MVDTVADGAGLGGALPGSLPTATCPATPAQRERDLPAFFAFCHPGMSIPLTGVSFASPHGGLPGRADLRYRPAAVSVVSVAAIGKISRPAP